jgi:hypothetical protein
MSAYSEWKYGLISDSEYNSICRREEAEDRYYQEHGYYEDEEVDEYDIYLD